MGYSCISQFAGAAWCLIFIIYLYTKVARQWLPLVKGRGTWMFGGWQHGMGDAWRVTTWYGDACGASWHEECLWRRCHDARGAPNFEDYCIFWIALSQNVGHIFCTRFCLAVNDNQDRWPAYNFFQQFFYWPFIIIYLTLELLWNKNIINVCDRPNRAVLITYPYTT